MTDTNRSRVHNRERFARNKNAFDEIFGDPFSHPPKQGQYAALKANRGLLRSMTYAETNSGTLNPARPNVIDFFCDAEHIAGIALKDDATTQRFVDTYINECIAAFTVEERTKLEQRIGQLLQAYGISPVSKYFRTIRRSRGE